MAEVPTDAARGREVRSRAQCFSFSLRTPGGEEIVLFGPLFGKRVGRFCVSHTQQKSGNVGGATFDLIPNEIYLI